jgi:putrescine aminotransferase
MKNPAHLILCRTPKERIRKGITVIARGEGVRVFDEQGRSYLDLTAGLNRPVHVGYGRREIAQAAYDQMCELAFFTPMEFANRPAIALSDKLAELAPAGIDHFLFVSDGSEAVEAALKLARHYHYYRGEKRRYKVISRRGAYHGVTAGALGLLGTVIPMRHIMEPLAPGSVFVESPYCYRCPFHQRYPECDLLCASDVERIIQSEDPEQISAFIGEPIQQGFGVLPPPAGYWEVIQRICRAYGIVLIVDEVICGFGRTGAWFGCQHFGIDPDMITMAKGLSSGYVPLGAVGCTGEIMERIEVFHHLHTYANHPVSCAAAVKNIEILEREHLIEKAREVGHYFLEGLRSLESHPSVGEVRGKGLWTSIDFTSDKKTKAPFPVAGLVRMVDRAMGKGLIIKTVAQALDFAPALTITKGDIDEGIRILDECISEEEREMGLRR